MDNNLKVQMPKNDFSDVVVISPGIKGGQDNILVQSLSDLLLKNGFAVVTWDFGFFMREEEGIDQTRELKELNKVLDRVIEMYPSVRVHLAGKSYGGLISSLVDPERFLSLGVFGLLKEFQGIVFTKPTNRELFAVHGSRDKFFTPEEIKNYLGNEEDLFIVGDADHGLGDADFNFVGENGLKWYVEKLKSLINQNYVS
ncbi:MAG: alpha/beta family hydrolase [Candidatus Dojkabacteria bacterium]